MHFPFFYFYLRNTVEWAHHHYSFRKNLFKKLISGKDEGTPLAIWQAGCRYPNDFIRDFNPNSQLDRQRKRERYVQYKLNQKMIVSIGANNWKTIATLSPIWYKCIEQNIGLELFNSCNEQNKKCQRIIFIIVFETN